MNLSDLFENVKTNTVDQYLGKITERHILVEMQGELDIQINHYSGMNFQQPDTRNVQALETLYYLKDRVNNRLCQYLKQKANLNNIW